MTNVNKLFWALRTSSGYSRYAISAMNMATVAVAAIASIVGGAQAQTFHSVKTLNAKGKEVDVYLRFDGQSKHLSVTLQKKKAFSIVSGDLVADVPYAAITKLSYGRELRRRMGEGSNAMSSGCIDNPAALLTCPGTLAAGLAVMFTKKTDHWLYVDYSQDGARILAFRLDKREYQQVLKTAREQTGKDVQAFAPQNGKPP